MKFTKSDYVTLIRLFLAPIIIVLILLNKRISAGVLYFLAASTDAIDGYVARKYKQITENGRYLDGVIDRIFLVTIIVTLAIIGTFKPWIIFILILVALMEASMATFITIKTKRSYLYTTHRGSAKYYAVLTYLCVGLYIFEFIYSDYVFMVAFVLGLYAFVDYLFYLKKKFF